MSETPTLPEPEPSKPSPKKGRKKDRLFGKAGETRSELFQRLRAAGLWPQFEMRLNELRTGGGVQSLDAWRLLADEEPFAKVGGKPAAKPKKEEPPPPDLSDIPDFAGEFDSNNTDQAADVRWAYQNLEKITSQPSSPGAVVMLKFARTHRTKFLSDVMPKFKALAGEEERLIRDDGRKFLDIIERFEHANGLALHSPGTEDSAA